MELTTENTQGQSAGDLDEGAGLGGAPKPPAEPSNKPPVDEGKEETFAAPDPAAEAAKATAKAAADKAAADEAAKAEADKLQEPSGPLKEYVTLDNPAGQAAIDVLKEAGVDPNESNEWFAKALESGDLKDVNWDAIEAKLGKSKAYLVRTGVEKYHADELSKTNTVVAQTFEIMGGKENWDKVKAWATEAEKGSPALKSQVDDIRELLNEGGSKAAAGARELLRLYNSDKTTTGLQNGKLVTGDSTGNVIGTPLARGEYLTELKAAHNSGASKQVIDSIRARRVAGMNAGL